MRLQSLFCGLRISYVSCWVPPIQVYHQIWILRPSSVGKDGAARPSPVFDLFSVFDALWTSGVARVRLADPNGPKWISSGQHRPKCTILVHFGLANAKIWFGIRSFRPKWSSRPSWTILVQYTFRQYCGHSLGMLFPQQDLLI